VKTASGTTVTDYPVSALATNPRWRSNPSVGTVMLDGDQGAFEPTRVLPLDATRRKRLEFLVRAGSTPQKLV